MVHLPNGGLLCCACTVAVVEGWSCLNPIVNKILNYNTISNRTSYSPHWRPALSHSGIGNGTLMETFSTPFLHLRNITLARTTVSRYGSSVACSRGLELSSRLSAALQPRQPRRSGSSRFPRGRALRASALQQIGPFASRSLSLRLLRVNRRPRSAWGAALHGSAPPRAAMSPRHGPASAGLGAGGGPGSGGGPRRGPGGLRGARRAVKAAGGPPGSRSSPTDGFGRRSAPRRPARQWGPGLRPSPLQEPPAASRPDPPPSARPGRAARTHAAAPGAVPEVRDPPFPFSSFRPRVTVSVPGQRGSVHRRGPAGRRLLWRRCVFPSRWVKGHASARVLRCPDLWLSASPPRDAELPSFRSEEPLSAGFLPAGKRSAAGLRCSPIPARSGSRGVSVKREIKLKGNGGEREARACSDRARLAKPRVRAFVLRCAAGMRRLHSRPRLLELRWLQRILSLTRVWLHWRFRRSICFCVDASYMCGWVVEPWRGWCGQVPSAGRQRLRGVPVLGAEWAGFTKRRYLPLCFKKNNHQPDCQAVSFSSNLRGYRWNAAPTCLDPLVVFFPLESTEPRQRSRSLCYLNLFAHWMRAAAVCAEFCPPCCRFWGCAAMCGLGGLTGPSCCWRAQGKMI